MSASTKTERQLLEQLVSDVADLKIGQKRHDKQFDAVIKTMNAGFAKNDAEHAEIRKTLSEHTGELVEIRHDIKRLDDEREVMAYRQDNLERLRG